jgi:two-component system, chemotaxis family, protein-glutamate methylesterase/glutaminase
MRPCCPVVATADTIIVIGTSAGGVTALRRLIAAFEPSWPVSVFITIHTGKNRNRMPDILNWNSRLSAGLAEHQKKFGRGIYLAPPDRHLIIGNGTMSLSAGPKENHSRPAIDPMFRSAARSHGSSVIGVLLTGHLYDGMNGIYDIHKAGGTTIVQDPVDAEVPDIPRHAIARLQPNYVLPLMEIPDAIAERLGIQQRSMERRSGQ